MLELKARCEPSQETPHFRPVNAPNRSSQPAGKGNSFNRILNKANQRSLNQKQAVNPDANIGSNTRRQENISGPKTVLDQPEKKAAAAPGNSDQQYEVSLEPGQSDQLDWAVTRQETAELDQSDDNTATHAGLLIAMPQASVTAVEVVDQSSSDSWAASTNSIAIKSPSDNQIELTLPLNEPNPLTEESVPQANDGQSVRASIPAEAEISQEVPVLGDQVNSSVLVEINNGASAKNASGSEEPSPLLNQLKASEPDIPVSQSARPAQQIDDKLATTAQTVMADLSEKKMDSSAIPQPAPSSPESNTTNVALALVAQALESTEPDKPAGNRSIAQDLTEPISSTAGGQEKINPVKVNKVLTPEDMHFKLMEKTLMDSPKTGQEQPSTDIKKLMVAESQRLSAAKPAAEGSIPTEIQIPVTKSQTETLSIVSGLEKAIYTPTQNGIEPQPVAAQSLAPDVDPQDLIEQIVKKTEMLTKANNSEIKIQLKPEFMGKMIIKIAIEDGLVTAKFITESQHVKQLLEANLGSLRQNLESQGLKVDRTEVNVQLDNGGSFHGNDSGRQQMWQEYSDRNAQNRFNYQTGEDYQPSYEATLDLNTESDAISALDFLGDGKVDFMI